jgi:hypothetical protein
MGGHPRSSPRLREPPLSDLYSLFETASKVKSGSGVSEKPIPARSATDRVSNANLFYTRAVVPGRYVHSLLECRAESAF